VLRFRPLFVLLATVACLLMAVSVAHAAGRVEWKDKGPKEREGGSWRLELALFLPSAPDVPHVPMKFEFQPIAYYERSMVDGDKLVERLVPLEGKQSLIESVDVGFMDSGSGNIEKRTRFTFKVTRAHGYEAGEYKVTIRDGRDGKTIGTPTTLKLNGENEVIDRRAMVFSGEKKKKKPEEAKPAADATSTDEAKDEPAAKDEAANEASSNDAEDDSEASGTEDGPPAIKEKPGGCGCKLQASSSSSPSGVLVLAFFAAVVLRRQRRRTLAA
jgi:MYXO-CTERM domain-containing protein